MLMIMNWIWRNISRAPRFFVCLFYIVFVVGRGETSEERTKKTFKKMLFFSSSFKWENNFNEWIENNAVWCGLSSCNATTDWVKKPTRKIKQVSINISRNSISSFYRWNVKDLNCICSYYRTVGFCGLNQYRSPALLHLNHWTF